MRTRLLIVGVAVLAATLLANSQALAIGVIRTYQVTLAPLLAQAGAVCRFSPSCSRYGEIAIGRDGVIVGGWKTAKRVLRCNPWTKMGTVDEP